MGLLQVLRRLIGRIAMAAIGNLVLTGFLLACSQAEQPERLRFVDVIEVELRTPVDRTDLLAILRRYAETEGLHLDDVSHEAGSPLGRTIYLGLWRGASDDNLEISVDDAGHPGRAWVIFSRGEQPVLATRLRERLTRELIARWPNARRIPVLPSGGLPEAPDVPSNSR